ncbi:MAG TPA: GHMP kinase [Blastocatellia bacterium]|nr:GHMP kinase [Blastocatellia bacterium]
MIIETKVPTRIDLAGGTIDLYPLFLFHEGAETVNFGIDQYARCCLETRDDGKFILEATDRGARAEYASFEELKHDSTVELLSKLVYFFRPNTGLTITTEATAPAGAGLGGSSALDIAICGALNQLSGNRYTPEELLTIAQNVETQVIKVPAGCQDYYPPMFGGVLALQLTAEGVKRQRIEVDAEELESRLVLCYTGAQRNSGINNWEIFKRHIDGNQQVINLLGNIGRIAAEMHNALIRKDYDMIGPLLDEEWQNRRQLAPGVSTPQIEELANAAKQQGAVAVKVCGAGGGGCVVFGVKKGSKPAVESVLRSSGAEVISFHVAEKGLT